MENDSFYKPSGKVKDSNRTYVPDLYRQVAMEMQEEEFGKQPSYSESAHVIRLQNRPLIGVFYSISAGIEGELFPVYVGRNTIGSDPSCDICLRETSVSAMHGMLVARKQTNEEGREYIRVILSDNNSGYGIIVNGQSLNFEKVECSDGDVIKVGQNYVLVLSLFNALEKLSIADGFDRIPDPQKSKEENPSLASGSNIVVGGKPETLTDDHSTSITQDPGDGMAGDLYRPTKRQPQDHYNNKTIIL